MRAALGGQPGIRFLFFFFLIFRGGGDAHDTCGFLRQSFKCCQRFEHSTILEDTTQPIQPCNKSELSNPGNWSFASGNWPSTIIGICSPLQPQGFSQAISTEKERSLNE